MQGEGQNNEENQAASVGEQQTQAHAASQAASATQSAPQKVSEPDDTAEYDGFDGDDGRIANEDQEPSDSEDWWSFLFGETEDEMSTLQEPEPESKKSNKASKSKVQAESKSAALAEPIESSEPVSESPLLPSIVQEAMAQLAQSSNEPIPEHVDWTQAVPSEQIVEAIKVHQRLQQEAELLRQAAAPLIRMGMQLTDQDIRDIAELAKSRQLPIDIAMKAWGYEYLLRREMGIPIGSSSNRSALPQFPMNPPTGAAQPSPEHQELRFSDYLSRLISM